MSSDSLKNKVINKLFTYNSYIYIYIYIYIYMCVCVKQYLALNNPQGLICHKIPNQPKQMIILGQSEYVSNGNEIQKWSLTTGCGLVC